MVDDLSQGRDSYRQHAWSDAHAYLTAADGKTPLTITDLENLAIAAYLVGKIGESIQVFTRAYTRCLESGDVRRAARCGFWLVFTSMEQGDTAVAGGWHARAQRLLDEAGQECVEHGYLLLPMALQSVGQGEIQRALDTFAQAARIGEKYRDRDLVAIARQGEGRALVALGETARGVALLDEVMVAVTNGEVSPIIAGVVYCSVIEACRDMFDLRRANEWTDALSRWCDSQPDMVPYRGQCLIHRAEIMQMRGDWTDAIVEAQRAFDLLSKPPPHPAAGTALYRRAEVHRLRGEFDRAEQAYRDASQLGQRPEPGLALLQLAQGQTDVAASATKRSIDEAGDRSSRAALLAAYIQIMLVTGDIETARTALNELSEIAESFDAPVLRANVDSANGAICLAEFNPLAALTSLRRAWRVWLDLDCQYEAARTRVLIGIACRDLGDNDAAQMEFSAALSVFEHLGAEPDIQRVNALSGNSKTLRSGGLTGREVEVLRLVASGKTNRVIAAELVISEKTVARHVSNIFNKLQLSSRSAATAYAYENGLL